MLYAMNTRSLRPDACRCAAQPRILGVVVALALMLAGCSGKSELEVAGHRPPDANKLHPIGAEMRRTTLDVRNTSADPTFESQTYLALTAFVRHYLRDGRGQLEVNQPAWVARSGSRDRSKLLVQSVINSHNISPDRIRYLKRRDAQHHTTLSFFEMAAISPTHCDDWSEDVTRRAELGPYPNFGCATQRNLANMVADPTDLVTPAAGVDRGSDRMTSTYKSYSSGGGAPAGATAAGR